MAETCDSNEVVTSTEFECPLLNRLICVGLCYDIQMIRHMTIKPEVIKDNFSFTDANRLCVDCPFNQLST